MRWWVAHLTVISATVQVVGSLSTTPPSVLSASPVGPLTDANSRKTLIYLILTLNHMYPDYDFSMLRAQHFRKEEDLRFARANIDNLMLETAKVSRSHHNLTAARAL
jgi:hypothetical protein